MCTSQEYTKIIRQDTTPNPGECLVNTRLASSVGWPRSERIINMTVRIVVYLVVFWLMQVVAQLFFKWGSGCEARWIWGFLAGNLFGFSSIWLLMLMYKSMNPNIALGIATGGALLLSQVVIFLVFNSKVSAMQWAGIIAIAVGMIALSAGGARELEPGARPTSAGGIATGAAPEK